MPMMLVSWFGADAYSKWANLCDWADVDAPGYLPSEAQWEFAARGRDGRRYPWGEAPPTPDRVAVAMHHRGAQYQPRDFPMPMVHRDLGVSPFGIRHMAGTVWQWCRDWYSPTFYSTANATAANAMNAEPTGIRSERGGSWVGPAFLCRSSCRRGRAPTARGRCLGFRCVSKATEL
jgi:formylglycine-generating enzyme required for sulfatase activity